MDQLIWIGSKILLKNTNNHNLKRNILKVTESFSAKGEGKVEEPREDNSTSNNDLYH